MSCSDQIRIPAARPAAVIGHAEALDGDWPAGYRAYPASYAQSRLWFLHQLTPGLTAYHVPAVWRLQGPLDISALNEALTALVERHPTLRSSFELRGGEVLQVVHPSAPVAAVLETLCGRDPKAVVDDWLEHERANPFDLRSGLLLRARLLAVSRDVNLLLLNHHHIASDGWSRSVLSHDLVEFYNAFREARAAQHLRLPVSYQDYAVWQRHRLIGERWTELRDYWTENLQSLEPLNLPADHLRPAQPSHRSGSVFFEIEQSLIPPFEDLCRSAGATLQMGLLAVVSLLLQRYSRQDDFAIGVPVWGRNHADLESVVGLFVNTLPIRMHVDPRESFRQLLTHVRDSSIGAYRHQEFPFEKMVEACNPERDTSSNPLIQVMFQLIGWPAPTLEGLIGLHSRNLIDRFDSARLDLEFILRRHDRGGLTGELLYATDLFNAERMGRLAAHLRALLASVVDDPDAPVGSHNLLPECEKNAISAWELGPNTEVPELGVHQLFEQQVDRTPDAAALLFQGVTLTYAELNRRANQLARHLIFTGVSPGTTVGVCLERSVELVVAILAILKVGGVYLPLDPGWPQARRAAIRRDSNAAVQIDRDFCRDAFGAAPKAVPLASPSVGLDQNSLAYVLYTSGSSGAPKGVAVPHGALANLIAWHRNDIRLGRPAMTLQFAAAVFDVSLQEIFSTLTAGGCLALIDEETRRDPRLLWKFIVDHKVERAFLPYVALEQLALAGAAVGAPGSASLVDIVSAGEKLALTEPIGDLLRSLPNCRLHNHYGPTESHVVSAHVIDDSSILQPEGVSIGTPIGNAIVRILDDSGQRCPVGVPGELHIGGRTLARGYLNNPELTAEKFIADPFCQAAEARLYRSGDLASWNADGTLCFHGRLDQQVKLRGHRIEPAEIEAVLLAYPAVAQAVVVLNGGGPGESSESSLIAYWVPRSCGASTSDGDLRAFLLEQLPVYMVPSAFIEVVALPLNTNGKLDRASLPPARLRDEPHERGDSLSPEEQQLQAIWSEILGHSDFRITDNFFLVGGNSLSAVRLATAIEKHCGRTLAISGIFARPTIEEQAIWLKSADPGLSDPDLHNLVVLQPKGHLPPLYAVHGWGGKVANFIGIARALAPRRPVFGLQGLGPDDADDSPSVTSIAARYADQILKQHPRSTPIHLMGFSAGGWFAYAVAAALRKRGATIGALVLLDTGPGVKIHRRFGAVTLVTHLTSRLHHHVKQLIRPPNRQSRRRYLAGRLRSLHGDVNTYARPPRKVHPPVEFYGSLLYDYRPPRLPLTVDLFARPARRAFLERIWRFYAGGGVRVHTIFNGHHDFVRLEFVPELVVELERALARAETRPSLQGR